MLAKMTIWKWLLVQIIHDGYPFKDHLIAFNETHILDVDDVRAIGVKKKKCSFHIKKPSVVDFEGSIFRIEKVLLEESMCNVGATCCMINCCQHFPCGKTLLLRQEFWNLSFEDHRTYGLDIPRRFHMKGEEI
jgi:hypothetical protein